MADWQPGDLALCVRWLSGKFWDADDARKGAVYTVSKVYRPTDMPTDGLGFVELNMGRAQFGYMVDAFRKIQPLTDAEHRAALEEMGVPEVAE